MRMHLTPDEVALVEELREKKAFWNSAIDAAIYKVNAIPGASTDAQVLRQSVVEELERLRK